jgi:hypothetical protein
MPSENRNNYRYTLLVGQKQPFNKEQTDERLQESTLGIRD